MTAPVVGTKIDLTITPAALAKIREVMAQQKLEADERNLRVFVEGGGGCCGGGPSFGLAFDKAQDDDAKFAIGGMDVVVDPMSLSFCTGATIDYIDTPQVQGFKVSAPAMQRESSGCGGGSCGSGGGCGDGEEHGHSHAKPQGGGCGGGGCGCG